MKLHSRSLLAGFILAGVMANAQATSVTYDYVGNSLQDLEGFGNTHVGERVFITAVFDDFVDNSHNNANFISMSDGINTIDTNNASTASSYGFDVENGNIKKWALSYNKTTSSAESFQFTQLESFGETIIYSSDDSFSGLRDFINPGANYSDYKYINFNPGTWTLRQEQVSSVPVPAALPLMATALGLFGFANWQFVIAAHHLLWPIPVLLLPMAPQILHNEGHINLYYSLAHPHH